MTVGALGKTEAGKEYEGDPDQPGLPSAKQRTTITIVHASTSNLTLGIMSHAIRWSQKSAGSVMDGFGEKSVVWIEGLSCCHTTESQADPFRSQRPGRSDVPETGFVSADAKPTDSQAVA